MYIVLYMYILFFIICIYIYMYIYIYVEMSFKEVVFDTNDMSFERAIIHEVN